MYKKTQHPTFTYIILIRQVGILFLTCIKKARVLFIDKGVNIIT